MVKYFVILLSIILWSFTGIYGQDVYTLKGQITDTNSLPIEGASVGLNPSSAIKITNEGGRFKFDKLRQDQYKMSVSFLGYKFYVDTIELNRNTTLKIQLQPESKHLDEVTVKTSYAELLQREKAVSIEVVNEDFIKQNLSGSLMQTIGKISGVRSMNIGSGQSKPVIRGLGFNRVVVVENNIKHEAQQWGADHGLEIDQYNVDQIEVIKGPASLSYGSEAIGGVIHLKETYIPLENTVEGVADLTYKSNNDLHGGSFRLAAQKENLYAMFRLTYLDYADYKVPVESVDIYNFKAPLHNNRMRNTAGEELNKHATVGYVSEALSSTFRFSSVDTKNGFFANAHGVEPLNVDYDFHDRSSRDILYPFQEVQHLKLTNSTQYIWNESRLSVDLGAQSNKREEWSAYTAHDDMPTVPPIHVRWDPELEREFDKKVYTGNAKFNTEISDQWKVEAGLNTEKQKNRIDGRGFLVPAYDQFTFGTFGFARYTIDDQNELQFGLRYDVGHLETKEYFDWYTTTITQPDGSETEENPQRAKALNKQFSNLTWSVGYIFNGSLWTFRANVGKSFRMPLAKELASNGINYHQFRYEIGNENLSPEVSYQLDLGAEYTEGKLSAELTPFVNYFTNYLYLNPTPDFDTEYGNGHQIYEYTESKVIRYGFELNASYQFTKELSGVIAGEYVYSEQLSGEKKGFPLPFSPPASILFTVRYGRDQIAILQNPYVSVDLRLTAKQNRVSPPEEPTGGSRPVDLSIGAQFTTWGQAMNLSVQVQNILNTKYFDHTSYYRQINVPESGRNVVVNLNIPFGIK